MRRLISVLLVLVMVLAIAPEFPELFEFEMTAEAAATGTTSDGYEYEVSDEGGVTITGYTGSETKVVIPESIEGYPVKVIGNEAFYERSDITSVIIPDGVTSIGDFTFRWCSSLASITIPKSVTSIGYFTFGNCSSLTSIIIPESVTSIGDRAFYSCDGLTSITIPDGVTRIGDATFIFCRSLKNITFPKNLTSIGDRVFEDCISLTNVILPESLTSIGDGAFSDCVSLTSITIPKSVTSIGSGVFSSCDNLASVTIEDGVTSIGDGTFSQCERLTSITIPGSVASIGENAFYHCQRLRSVTIADGVSSIEGFSFFACEKLTCVSIPLSVKTIKAGAFYWSDNISHIYYAGTEEQWNEISINYNNDNLLKATIHYLGSTEITSVDITDIDMPVAGYLLDTNATYTVKGVENTNAIVEWFDVYGNKVDTAIADSDFHIVKVTLKATNGEVFASDISATVNGNTAAVMYHNSDGTFSVEYALKTINSIQIEAEDYDSMSGVTLRGTKDQNSDVISSIDAGDYMIYTVDIPETGIYRFDVRAARNDSSTSIISLMADDNLLANCSISKTGGWSLFSEFKGSEVKLTAGTYTFKMYASGGRYNLNWYKLVYVAAASNEDGNIRIEAENYDSMSGVTLRGTKEQNSEVISSVDSDDYMIYTVDIPKEGIYRFDVRAARSDAGTSMLNLMENDRVIATCGITKTGGWSTFSNLKGTKVYLTAGAHTFKVYAQGGRYNLNWYDLVFVGESDETSSDITTDDILVEAESYDSMSGVALRGIQEKGSDVISSIDAGDYMVYTVEVPASGIYRFDVSAARSDSGTSILNLMENDNLIATCGIKKTGDWSTFMEFKGTGVHLTAGTHTFKLYAKGGRYNLNWYKLTCVEIDVYDPSEDLPDTLVLAGDEEGADSMIGTYTAPTYQGQVTDDYKYLGYVSFLDSVPEYSIEEGNYRYLVITYTGDITRLRFGFEGIHNGTSDIEGEYWFDPEGHSNYFVSYDGRDIPLVATEPTTITIDLKESVYTGEAIGVDLGWYNAGIHMHCDNMVTYGNGEGITILDAYLLNADLIPG